MIDFSAKAIILYYCVRLAHYFCWDSGKDGIQSQLLSIHQALSHLISILVCVQFVTVNSCIIVSLCLVVEYKLVINPCIQGLIVSISFCLLHYFQLLLQLLQILVSQTLAIMVHVCLMEPVTVKIQAMKELTVRLVRCYCFLFFIFCCGNCNFCHQSCCQCMNTRFMQCNN